MAYRLAEGRQAMIAYRLAEGGVNIIALIPLIAEGGVPSTVPSAIGQLQISRRHV